ncbi:ParB family protein [Calothrix sp. NIES-4071]|nr:ParB family protein [Calothrix sp. NIES-4071]BAZ54388.1 ParB family protein [Calothrix sp. NIES-4105]
MNKPITRKSSKKEEPYTQIKTPAVLFGAQPTNTEALNKAPTNTVPLNLIKLPSSQPRRYFDPAKLEELSRSIKQFGVLEPLLVRPLTDGEYELIAGERRLKASIMAGLTEAPVVVHDMDSATTHTVRLIENLQREDLNPIEETEGILELLALTLQRERSLVVSLLYRMQNEAKGIVNQNVLVSDESLATQDVFKNLGKITWESFVTTRLPLLKLPEDVLLALREGKLEYTKACAIAKVKDEDARGQVLEKAINEDLSLAKIKELIQQFGKQKPNIDVAPHKVISQRYTDIGKRLKQAKVLEDAKKRKKVEKLLNDLEKLIEDSQIGAVQDNL